MAKRNENTADTKLCYNAFLTDDDCILQFLDISSDCVILRYTWLNVLGCDLQGN